MALLQGDNTQKAVIKRDIYEARDRVLACVKDNAGQVLHRFMNATWPTPSTSPCTTTSLIQRQHQERVGRNTHLALEAQMKQLASGRL